MSEASFRREEMCSVHLSHAPDFIEKHREFLSLNKRGGGYWIWKPYVIQQKLKDISDGEYLLYADAGCTVSRETKISLNEYLTRLEAAGDDILCFKMDRCLEKSWNKADLFSYLDIDPEGEIANSGQILGGIMLFKKTPESVQLVDDWLALCENYHLVDDSPSLLQNSSTFIEHRHDQSIFSLLAKSRGVTPVDGMYFIVQASKIRN